MSKEQEMKWIQKVTDLRVKWIGLCETYNNLGSELAIVGMQLNNMLFEKGQMKDEQTTGDVQKGPIQEKKNENTS